MKRTKTKIIIEHQDAYHAAEPVTPRADREANNAWPDWMRDPSLLPKRPPTKRTT